MKSKIKILENKLKQFEEDIFEGKNVDLKEFYRLKKRLLIIMRNIGSYWSYI